MHPDTLLMLALERSRELQEEADCYRLARAAAPSDGSPSPRQRLGRRLISLGTRLADTGP